MALDNCNRCGKLFVNNFRQICPACIKDIDEEYMRCSDFLRHHKKTTITELSEETSVSVKQITQFIREGRISLSGLPNLGYPCEMCGASIRESNMCVSCRTKLLKGVGRNADGRQDEFEKNKQNSNSYQIKDRLWDR